MGQHWIQACVTVERVCTLCIKWHPICMQRQQATKNQYLNNVQNSFRVMNFHISLTRSNILEIPFLSPSFCLIGQFEQEGEDNCQTLCCQHHNFFANCIFLKIRLPMSTRRGEKEKAIALTWIFKFNKLSFSLKILKKNFLKWFNYNNKRKRN